MTDADLDRSYSALAEALTHVGEEQSPVLLSMVCLALMARMQSAADVLPVIADVRQRLSPTPPPGVLD